MKFLKLLVVPAMLLLLVSVARADDITVVLDPGPMTNPPPAGFYPVYSTSGVIPVSWGSCNSPGIPGYGGVTPAGLTNLTGYDGCIIFGNLTGATINFLSITITSNSMVPTQAVSCHNLDTFVIYNDCGGMLTPGAPVTLDFFGGPGVPGIPPSLFYIAESGVTDLGDLTTTAQVPTYDPNTLVLLAVGIAALAMGGAFRLYA